MISLSFRKVLFGFFVISSFALLFAYIGQYFFDLKPCVLCLYQRIPFFAILFLSLSGFVFKNREKTFFALCLFGFLVNIGLSGFHVGVEEGVFEMKDKCEIGEIQGNTVEELRKALLGKGLSRCDEVQFSLFGISMAGWNFLLCLVVLTGGVLFWKRGNIDKNL